MRTLDNGTAAGSSLPSMDKAHSVSIACSEVFLYESSLRDDDFLAGVLNLEL